MRHHRRFKNFLIKPSVQLRYAYYLLALILGPVSVLIFYVTTQLITLRLQLVDQFQASPESLAAFQTIFYRISLASGIVLICLVASVIYGTILISHRFVGPMLVINRFLEKLPSGDADWERQLRKDDELQETFQLIKAFAKQVQSENSRNSEKAPV